MTSRPDWADKAADEFFYGDLGDRKGFAQALRSAYAEGERANHWRTLALNVVAAWEVLNGGRHNNRVVEQWLHDDMAPAINAIRAAKETKE